MLNEIDLARAALNRLTLFEVIRCERYVGRAAVRSLKSAAPTTRGVA
jgi:hypothetical protein